MHSRDRVGNVTELGSGWNPSMESWDRESVGGAIDQGQDSGEKHVQQITIGVC